MSSRTRGTQRTLRAAAVLFAAVALSACGSTYVAKPYDRSAAGVSTLAVVDDPLPEKAMAYEVASAGSNFGLIGALVDAGIQSSRQNAVNEALTGVGFDAEAKLKARLLSSLTEEGYRVNLLDNGPRPKREPLKTYPDASGDTDAYLDVTVTAYGYMSSGAGQPFRPAAAALVRLVSAKDTSKVLMENQIVYNPLQTPKGVITLPPNPAYTFRNRGELLEDPQRLADGVEDALNQIADTAARLLR